MPDTEQPAPAAKPGARWADLAPRVISAAVLIAVTLAALFAGPGTWALYITLMLVLAFRELARLAEIDIPEGRRWAMAALGLIPVVILFWGLGKLDALPPMIGRGMAPEFYHPPDAGLALSIVLALAVPLALGALILRKGRIYWLSYGLVVELGALFVGYAPAYWAPSAVVLLVAVIAASDMAGYFVGRSVGGPKFWPRVSPKKTWSGTIGGWVAAGLVGAIASALFGWGGQEAGGAAVALGALVAVLLAFAGQMGDIVESALKRRVGLKDSSTLIPGHGGILDRIDALVAAAAVAALVHMLGFLNP